MVHVFYTRATNGRTIKIKYELVAPNIRRSVFEDAKYRTNSNVAQSLSRQFRHKKESRNAGDVITYPLIQETFELVESNVECDIDRQKLELDLVRNKSEKDVAKIVSFTIMRFPR
jgi:hypothetical protein